MTNFCVPQPGGLGGSPPPDVIHLHLIPIQLVIDLVVLSVRFPCGPAEPGCSDRLSAPWLEQAAVTLAFHW